MTFRPSAALALAAVLFSGCSGLAADTSSTTSTTPTADPLHRGAVLLDYRWSVPGTSQMPPGGEDDIGAFNITEGRQVVVYAEAKSLNLRVTADALRVYDPEGNLADQAAFSNQQYLNLNSSGTASLNITATKPGTWRVVLLWDHYDQRDTVEGHTLVTVA